MEKNIGTKEAHIRTITAVVLLLLALVAFESPFLKIVLAFIAAILAGTAFLRTCPLYFVLKKNTYDGGEPMILPPVVSVPAEEVSTVEEKMNKE